MKKTLMSTDSALITLWSILLMSSLFANNDLLFGWPIQVHITLTAALIMFRMLIKKTV